MIGTLPLYCLWGYYPDDDFFVRYGEYIVGTSSDDNTIGGKDEVKKKFAELQKWAKQRLEYDLVFSPEEDYVVMGGRQ